MKRTLLGLLPLFTAVSLYAADEERCIEVTLNAPGQLGQVLGERIHEVDSLVVTGPMDSRDFQFIKTAYDKGNASAGIRVINIEGAEVEDNVLPLGAFSGISYRLERVMLPDTSSSRRMFSRGVAHARSISPLRCGQSSCVPLTART